MRAEMQAWWEEFQQHFDGPVEFAETADVTTHLAGGSDAAGWALVEGVQDFTEMMTDAEFFDFRPPFLHSAP